MIEMSLEVNELAKALADAQAEIEGASKDKTNPHFKSRYADLASVWDACRAPLSKHGLSIIQGPSGGDGTATIALTTLVLHASGQWVKSTLAMTAQQNTPQAIGSCLTYLRRYALSSMVGVAPEDDDGNAASVKADKPQLEVKAPATVKPAPEGAVHLQKVEQHETSAGKVYFQIVTNEGESLMTWTEAVGKAAEQACQDGIPVRLQVRGTYEDMAVIKSLTLALPPAAEDALATIAQVFNKTVPPGERAF